MTVNTTIPPSCWCHNLCSGWWHTLLSRPTWGSGRHSHFPSIKLNFVSHSDQSQVEGCCCWYIMTNPPPPAFHHPPLALSLTPTSLLPSRSSVAFWMQIRPHWGKKKKKKRLKKEQSFGPSSNKCPMQELEQKTVCSFQEVIFIFSKEGDTAGWNVQTDRQLQDERTRDRRWKCPWLWLRTALLSCAQRKLMWKHVTLGYLRITSSTDTCCFQKFKTGKKKKKKEHCWHEWSVNYCF